MRTETFQLTMTSPPLAGVDRSGGAVVDFRGEVSDRVSREGDRWEPTGRQDVHVRVRGEFADRVAALMGEGDRVIVTGPLIEAKPDADPFDVDGPLPRLLATVIARPIG